MTRTSATRTRRSRFSVGRELDTTWVLTLALISALLTACGRSGPAQGASSTPLFDPAEALLYSFEPGWEPTAATLGLLEDGALEREDWIPAVALTDPQDPELLAELIAGSTFENDKLRMTTPRGSWLRWLELPENLRGAPITVSGRLSTDGFSGNQEDSFARVVLAEVPGSAPPAQLSEIPDVLISQEGLLPRSENASGSEALFEVGLHTSPEATHLGLLLELNFDAEKAQLAGLAPNAVFSELRVEAASPCDDLRRAAHLDGLGTFEETWSAASLARFDVEFVSRRGIVVPEGGSVELVRTVPPGMKSVELFVARSAGEARSGSSEPLKYDIQIEFETDSRLSMSGPLRETTSGSVDLWGPIYCGFPSEKSSLGPVQEAEQRFEGKLRLRLSVPARTDVDPNDPREGVVFAGLRMVPANPRPTTQPNLLLVSLDTVRADHLSLYGYDRMTDPNLVALGERSTVFEAAWATSPYTLPSHASLFTGQVPQVHGVERPSQVADPAASTFLAERLAESGYRTAAFTGGAMLLPAFGFARGFERYSVLDPIFGSSGDAYRERFSGVPGLHPDLFARNDLGAIEDWIQSAKGEPWFCFVHTYAAHEFEPADKYLKAIGAAENAFEENDEYRSYLARPDAPPPEAQAWLTDQYDGGIRQADELLGGLLEALERQGLSETTIVAVVSDHGKELGERGLVGHGHQLFEELLHVPALLYVPGREARRVAEPMGLADIATTLLAELELDPLPHTQGRNLFEPAPEGHAVLAAVQSVVRSRAMRRGNEKWLSVLETPSDWPVEYPRRTRFDLASDPGELQPLGGDPGLAQLDQLDASLRALGVSLRGGPSASELDARDRSILEALGYVDSKAPGAASPPSESLEKP